MLKRQRQKTCFMMGLVTLTICAVGVVGCAPSDAPAIRAEQNAMTNDVANGSANANTSNTQKSHEQIHENIAKQDGSTHLSSQQSAMSTVSGQESSLQLGAHLADSPLLGPQRFMPGDTVMAQGE